MASRWSFIALMWYICILCVQPQNRFTFLYPLHIAEIVIIVALVLHVMSCSQEGRPILRLGPASILALALLLFSYVSLHIGEFQTQHLWTPNIDIIFKNSLVLLLVEASAYNVRRVWGVQITLLFTTLWWVKAGLRLSATGATYSGDRIMGAAVSLIENPNAFAYLMSVMLPMFLFFFQYEQRKGLRYLFFALALASVYIILQTGSRTGFIALLVLSLFLVPRYLARHKAMVVVGAVVLYWIFSIVSPGNIARFRTIPSSVSEFLHGGQIAEAKSAGDMTRDEQSAWERRMKNRHTWELVKRYPFFGVGIDADDALIPYDLPYARGQVHNEFLYAGKQMGVIGIMLYVFLLGTLIFRGWTVQRICKNWWPACSDLGWTLKLQGIVFLCGGFFSPIAWNPLFLILAGSASALLSNIRQGSYTIAPTANTGELHSGMT